MAGSGQTLPTNLLSNGRLVIAKPVSRTQSRRQMELQRPPSVGAVRRERRAVPTTTWTPKLTFSLTARRRPSDRFEAAILNGSRSASGRFEPAAPRRTGRSRSAVVRWQHGGLLPKALLTLMTALASGLDVGLMVLTRLSSSGGDRLLALPY